MYQGTGEEMIEENGLMVDYIQAREELARKQLSDAAGLVGHVLSTKERQSESYSMLYDIFIKLRGLVSE